jgi:uncharacterized protein (DUF2147 family)
MKKIKLLFAFLLIVSYLPGFAADSPVGDWLITDNELGDKRAVIHFTEHNGILNGTIAKIYRRPDDTGVCSTCPGHFKDKPVVGLQIVWDLKEESPGTWSGGYVLDAKKGKIYRVKMTVKGDKLYLRGYVGVSLLGRTEVWTRV